MRLIDAPLAAGAIAPTSIIVDTNLAEEGVGHWIAPMGALNARVVRVALDCV